MRVGGNLKLKFISAIHVYWESISAFHLTSIKTFSKTVLPYYIDVYIHIYKWVTSNHIHIHSKHHTHTTHKYKYTANITCLWDLAVAANDGGRGWVCKRERERERLWVFVWERKRDKIESNESGRELKIEIHLSHSCTLRIHLSLLFDIYQDIQ